MYEAMMKLYILLVSWVITVYAESDAQLHPIKTGDLQRIVDSVKKDVDRHIKMAYAARRMESLGNFPDLSAVADARNEYKSFVDVMQDSLHRHLFRNLGQYTEADNDGSTTYVKYNAESTSGFESVSEEASHSENANEDLSESSSQAYEIRIGREKGVPGVTFPDYTDIPITSFTCSDKPHRPGFYADLDTGCQVFHVCWPDRKESFLCPMGTTFNQALGVCDYWYNSNCSLAPYYYAVNAEVEPNLSKDTKESASSMIKTLLEETGSAAAQESDSSTYSNAASDPVSPFIAQFMPMKVKMVIYPKTSTQRLKIVTTASVGKKDKPDLKLKPRINSRFNSMHSRVPRSPEDTKSSKDAGLGELPENYPTGRMLFLIYKAFDLAAIDIENNETLQRFSGYAKTAVEKMKSFFSWVSNETLETMEHFNPEPGSEAYKRDLEWKELLDSDAWKNYLLVVAAIMDRYHEKEQKLLRERDALKSEPLTNLNPKFITKSAAEQTSRFENKEFTTLNRVKRSATISDPSKLTHEDRLNIHPETKKLLIKSYTKLFKAKHRHA